MIFTIIVAIFSIIALIIIHELGHFIVAKKFGVKVEEFGIFLPPRLFGKKIGETIYSINLIPFGAFVKVHGEEGGVEDAHSFTEKPIWQRALIIAAGVISFWIVSAVILTMVAGIWGLTAAVEDNENGNIINPQVRIMAVAAESPAQQAGIKIGDIIVGFERVDEFQKFIEQNKGEEISLKIKRGKEVFESPGLVPRVSPPQGEGSLGVGLVRVASRIFPWYRAPLEGIKATGRLAFGIIGGWSMALKHFSGAEKLPDGVEMEFIGPVGIVGLLGEYFAMGISDFLFFIALISVALALINILPIPALDGGKLLFLIIEKIKGSPINRKIEQNITAGFFVLLILLMLFITVKFDIPRLF